MVSFVLFDYVLVLSSDALEFAPFDGVSNSLEQDYDQVDGDHETNKANQLPSTKVSCIGVRNER